jgi:ribA/ribD-fused uncharacterized protein
MDHSHKSCGTAAIQSAILGAKPSAYLMKNMNFYLEELKTSFNAGGLNKEDLFFFWGHTPKSNGVDKSCLSQWFHSPFKYKSVTMPTAEHFMMAKKAEFFQDKEAFQRIMQAASPHEAKMIGREVKNFNAAAWDEYAPQVVLEGNYHKFTQNRDLITYLRSTEGKILVEASPYDKIWGIGLKQDSPLAQNPNTWKGTNYLGFVLTSLRDELLR